MKILQNCCVLIFASSLIIACKKETKLLTTRDGLSHSWKLKIQGSDIDKDNKFDLEEKNIVPDSAQITYQFKNNGSGFRIGFNNTYVDSLSWDLTNNESILYLKIEDKGFINYQYYKFEYSPNTLILRDTTVSPSFYRTFERQD